MGLLQGLSCNRTLNFNFFLISKFVFYKKRIFEFKNSNVKIIFNFNIKFAILGLLELEMIYFSFNIFFISGIVFPVFSDSSERDTPEFMKLFKISFIPSSLPACSLLSPYSYSKLIISLTTSILWLYMLRLYIR